VPGLAGVAAVGPPIDLVRCAELIARPDNWRYERYFARGLFQRTRRWQQRHAGLLRRRLPLNLTLRQFDDWFTAPVHGFADGVDYYRRASALPYIRRIRVPGYILTARDDPFIAVEPFAEAAAPPHVTVRVTERGGHLGFLGRHASGGIRWGERLIADWVVRAASV
jgi:predicted alpha/beta-fold hydrolase